MWSCGWVDRRMFKQSNARGIMIVKNMHKCHKHHAILHKLCMWFCKNELRLYLKEQKFLRLGGGTAPSKYAHGRQSLSRWRQLKTARPAGVDSNDVAHVWFRRAAVRTITSTAGSDVVRSQMRRTNAPVEVALNNWEIRNYLKSVSTI